MANPKSFYSQTIADNTVKKNGEPESAVWAVAVTTLTAANYVAQKALIDDLAAAVAPFVLGNILKTEIVIDREKVSGLPAPDILAQRENKLLLRYEGAVSLKPFRTSIPTLDLTTLVDHTEFVDLTTGDGAALKAAFEAIVKSPDDGAEAVTLLSAQFVGRNT